MVRLVRHRQTKGPETDRPYLPHRATSRLHTCAFALRVSRPTRVEWRHEGVAMGEEESASADLERLCQGISPSVGACTYPATVRCTSCKKWFCDAHAEDGQWHSCMPSDQ